MSLDIANVFTVCHLAASAKHSTTRVPEAASGRLFRRAYRNVRGPKWHLEVAAHVMRCSMGVYLWPTPVEHGIRLGPSRLSFTRAGRNLLR